MAFRSTDLVFSNRDLDNKLKKFNARIKAAAKTLGEDSTTLRDLRNAANGLAMQIPDMVKVLYVTSYNGTEVPVHQLSRSSRLLGNLDQVTLDYINKTLNMVEQTTITSEMSKIGSTLGVNYRTKVGKEKIRTKITADSIKKKNMNSNDANVALAWGGTNTVTELIGRPDLLDYIMTMMAESRYTPEDFYFYINEIQKGASEQIEEWEDEIDALEKERTNLILEVSEMEEERSATAGYDFDNSEIHKTQMRLQEVEDQLMKTRIHLERLREGKKGVDMFSKKTL